ncbi:MBL fold metallo-hydrolase [Pseudoxanthomonas winnipegensis]|uniref:Hydrolase n=1 Tax=Pseudoxanthomonas winnipegensis TaxID=2480810 RepID=A0A4Q8LP17_9GAMM|nr:MBL fold metallo-hydrolase [Pseudoxanthomonas winnipegensis]RZZ89600.1 hydrolase [Pseudoxanthomonas winnipegensis]TAA32959.1 hydrolase [Pseudoxanthomonas winnipegensis]TBV78559.1 hydrolase [Pseudoxanthomonas winnipegensis]
MADSNEPGSRAASLQSSAGRFRNATAIPRTGLLESLRLFRSVLFHKPRTSVPDRPIPVCPVTRAELLAAPDFSLYRLGHSTVLLKLRGQFWITDPVFAQRASPLPWMGPKRFHAPPIALKDLPPLKGVILSHNHYDHLDKAAVRALAASAEHFVAPLGVGDTLVRWGVPAAKVQQLDWWQSTVIDGLRLVATPAQHFSGRGLRDGNATLWCSWVLIDDGLRVFFSGDSGYFDGFRQIGERFGPFDLILVETGAYDRQWPHVHMRPEESLQAHLDLQGRWMLPIHNGTFDLALHPWFEPFERISALAAERGVALSTPVIGERVDLRQPTAGSAWWRLPK